MTLITAERTAHYRRLADDADAALARGDEMGMELLRSLIPEITDAIEEINDGLREASGLLFEGLRDEAIGLHDAALPEVAIRLHLADKPRWQPMAAQFQVARIALPPELDFEALTALNAAFAEAERLHKPLVALRRLALERAPLADRVLVLRELCTLDATRPVWAEQLAACEWERLVELTSEVSAALKDADVRRLAALEAELCNPERTVAAPDRLVQQVAGANAWLKLQRCAERIERLAPAIEQEFSLVTVDEDPDDDPDRVDRLRELCGRWEVAEDECRDLIFSIPQHLIVSRLAQPEDFGPRIEMAGARVRPVLDWLSAMDAQDRAQRSFRKRCDELRKLAAQRPAKSDAAAWRRRVTDAEVAIEKLLADAPGLLVPKPLSEAVEAAKVELEGRSRFERRVAAAVLAVVLVTVGVVGSLIVAMIVWGRRS